MDIEDFDEEDFEDFASQLPRVEIPDEFKSDLTGERFTNCNICDRDLLNGETPYVIEKSFKRYDDFKFQSTVFEYAICQPCAAQLQQSMSKESMANIQRFFQERARMMEHQIAFMMSDDEDAPNWKNGLASCLITGTDSEECKEYQIMAQCQGDQMLVFHMPFMLSGEAMDEMSELLSQKTIDEMDDFMGKFGVPPELRELFSGRPVLVM